MKDREQLLNIILLQVNESYLQGNRTDYHSLVEEALDFIKPPQAMFGVTDEASAIEHLKSLAVEMLVKGNKEPVEIDKFITRIKVLAINFKHLFDLICEELAKIPLKEQKQLKKDVRYYAQLIRDKLDDLKFTRIMRQKFFDFQSNTNIHTDKRAFLDGLIESLQPYTNSSTKQGLNIPGINNIISLANRDQVANIIQTAQQICSDDGMMVTDIQGWNALFGGGLRRGEIIDLDAMTGRGKSDTVRRIIRGIARSNKPYMLDPNKKPALLIFTLEDTPDEILSKMYCDIREEEEGQPIDITKVDRYDVAEYVESYIGVNGYKLLIVEGEKHAVNVDGWRRLIDYIEADGYEIHLAALDYLQLMRYDDMPGGNPATQIKNVLGKTGEYCKQRLITYITCNQLDTKAKEHARTSIEIAREVVGKNFQENCKSITNEVDMELCAHVATGSETEDGFAYHQLARGKHRNGKKTPVGDRYAVYAMHRTEDGKPIGFIKGDLGGPAMVRNRTAGALRSAGGGEIW